jgi:hypothetical protein
MNNCILKCTNFRRNFTTIEQSKVMVIAFTAHASFSICPRLIFPITTVFFQKLPSLTVLSCRSITKITIHLKSYFNLYGGSFSNQWKGNLQLPDKKSWRHFSTLQKCLMLLWYLILDHLIINTLREIEINFKAMSIMDSKIN